MKTRLTIEIDKETKEKFLAKAKKEGRSMKWIILTWIENWLKDND